MGFTMMLLAPLAMQAPLAIQDWLDTRIFGQATLIAIAAFVLGYVVYMIWPKGRHPHVFGTLAALALLGGLAYIGNPGAGLALVLAIVVAVVLAVAGVLI